LCSLSTLQALVTLHLQDSLPVSGQALPGRIGYLLGCFREFQVYSIPPLQVYPGATVFSVLLSSRLSKPAPRALAIKSSLKL
jgi:hypothetical protein